MHSLNINFMQKNLNTKFIFQRVGHNIRLQPQSTAQIKEEEKPNKQANKTPQPLHLCVSINAKYTHESRYTQITT